MPFFPQGSSVKTTDSKGNYISEACNSCRTQKIKCSLEREPPGCSNCVRRGNACQYPTTPISHRSAEQKTVRTSTTPILLYNPQTSPGTKTGSKGKYLSGACNNCRSRKIKCEFEQDNRQSCLNCIRREIVCTYHPTPFPQRNPPEFGPKVKISEPPRKENVGTKSSSLPPAKTLAETQSNHLSMSNWKPCAGHVESVPQWVRTLRTSTTLGQMSEYSDDETQPSRGSPNSNERITEGSIHKSHVWSGIRPSISPSLHHKQTRSQYLQPPTYSGQRITANLAADHVAAKGTEIINTLARYGWEGSYLLQVGFNAELLRLGQGILQEIYIFLESELDPAVAKQLAAILDPFPVTIYTPQEYRHVPWLPENESIWDLWSLRGIHRESIQSQAAAPVDGNEYQKSSTNSAFSQTGSASGSGGGQGSREDKGAGNGPPNRAGDSSGGYSGAGGNADNTPNINAERPSTREISIPFSSTLTCVGDRPHPPIRFKTNACVEIKIEENYRSKSRPTGLYWGGPWFEARMALLDAEIQTAPADKPEYHLNFAQIRFITSKSPSSILNFTPSIIRAEDDNVKSKTERNTSGGIRAAISTNPSLKFEGTHSQTSGEERTQKRWEVVGHCLPSDRNDITGAPQTTMIWKYMHNTVFYPREARNIFEPRPAATFGLSRTSEAEPCLEVEVVTSYSWSAPSQTFRDWFTGRSKSKNRPPAFLNFLHQTSVVIDLEKVKESTEWVVGLTADEQKTGVELGKASKATVRQLESNDGTSDCHVSLQAALHGRIDLSEEQRRDAQPLLESLRKESPSPHEEGREFMSVGLLTPSPSPSPTLSRYSGRLGQSSGSLSTGISGEDMDMDIDT